MHKRIMRDISLIFNEFRVAPLGFNDLFASYIYSSHFIFSGLKLVFLVSATFKIYLAMAGSMPSIICYLQRLVNNNSNNICI